MIKNNESSDSDGEYHEPEYESDKEESEEIDMIIHNVNAKGKQKKGRKPQWTTQFTNDLVDVILSNEKHTNSFQFLL